MKVIIEEQVHQSILEFYAISMRLHPTLTEETVMAKIGRLIGAMNDLGKHPFIYADARLKKSWIAAEYKETIVEDFHIAYSVELPVTDRRGTGREAAPCRSQRRSGSAGDRPLCSR